MCGVCVCVCVCKGVWVQKIVGKIAGGELLRWRGQQLFLYVCFLKQKGDMRWR